MSVKTANLLFIERAYKSLTEPVFDISGENLGFQIDRSQEFDTLSRFTEYLIEPGILTIPNLDDFIIGYKTVQLQKEFDLLKVFGDSVVNIELKSKDTGEKTLKQLQQNKRYLETAFSDDNKAIYCFAFIGNEKERMLYWFVNNELQQIESKFLINLLSNDQAESVNLDEKFHPSKFLTAPYNNPEKFIENIYCLTQSQEDIENNVRQCLTQKEENFILIKGRAGTGKSLVALDLYKRLSKDHEVLFVFGANLNEGQNELRNKYSYNIVSAKEFKGINAQSYDAVIVDEGQRLYGKSFEKLARFKQVVVFFDSKQQISNAEKDYETVEKLRNRKTVEYNLKEKIRTNPELADFIKGFFDLKQHKAVPNDIVEVIHVKDKGEAEQVIKYFESKNYSFYNMTPSRFDYDLNDELGINGSHKTTHQIISLECDKVVVLLDNNFGYNLESRKLMIKANQNPYYPTTDMLFQNMTRARYKLAIVIIDNEELYKMTLTGKE
ncbi:hypothetical protein OfM1_11720 [Lactovum odontotermitis]